jgi:hypothetical protein
MCTAAVLLAVQCLHVTLDSAILAADLVGYN